MRHKLLISALIASVLIQGCETTAMQGDEDRPLRGVAAFQDDARLGEKVNRICFASQIDGFHSATRDTVIVEGGARKEFLVEMFAGCSNLKSAQALSLPKGYSCLSDRDNIIVHESAFGTAITPFSNQSCSIKSIHRWNEKVDAVDMEGLTDADVEPSMAPMK